MILKIIVNLKVVTVKVKKSSLLCGLLCGMFVPLVQGANNIPPLAQATTVNITFDRMSPPAKLFIWDNVFGGSSDGCSNLTNCNGQDTINSLVCYSTNNSQNGACPVNLFWNKDSDPMKLMLIFTHKETGKRRYVQLSSYKATGFLSWVSGSAVGSGFSTYIMSSELKSKLDLAGIWQAELKMQVKAWEKCDNHDDGCPGVHRAGWKANITLNVTDYGNQQIYLPAFPTSAPIVNLNLNTRPGTGAGKTVSGSTHLDMCLYDGNDSASNRISLRLQDEGVTAAGRPAGQFSIYRRGGNKSKASDRLDYQVSVINPTTGASQALSNGTEIIWRDTNRRNIQRQVILPGISKPALCVPAPLTLKTPAFSLSDKTAGDYTGTLRIIFTPTTQ
jgi:hypothetical protein